MAELDIDVIRHALRVARDRGFTEVELEVGDSVFEAKLGAAPSLASQAPAVSTAVVQGVASREDGLTSITSPVVGYLKEAGSALTIGRRVEKGEVVALVAALGLANDIESSASGEVVDVLVQPGEPVEYGQVVAKVKVS
jgi:acetyl-CoA carboxylase biotin carboxyl carrier protein